MTTNKDQCEGGRVRKERLSFEALQQGRDEFVMHVFHSRKKKWKGRRNKGREPKQLAGLLIISTFQ